jgi:pimeloyl-ACP methyl ester carboxylesterase
MGSSPSQHDLTKENLENAELEILKHAGLDMNEIERKNVKVGTEPNGNDIYIRTLMCGDKQKPTLVLVHGFAGSGALFYKIMKILCSRFYVIYLDMPGMGGSSSPTDFKDKTFSPKEVTNYFVEYFEKWRIEMDNLTDFYLSGHSYGGFMVGHYACKYHQHIRKLLLLSPVGIRHPTEEEYSPNYDPFKAFAAQRK